MTNLMSDDLVCIPCGGEVDPSKGCNPLSPIDICPNEGDEVVENSDDVDIEVEEARIPKVRRDPARPSAEERAHHDAIHLPFRSWCPDCVKGRADSNPHFKDKEKKERLLNGFHADYWFLRNENGDKENSLLVCQLRKTFLNTTLVMFAIQRGATEISRR